MSPKQDVPLGAGDALRQPFAECPRLLHHPREEEEEGQALGSAAPRAAQGRRRRPAGREGAGDGMGCGGVVRCGDGGDNPLVLTPADRRGRFVPTSGKPQKRGFSPKSGWLVERRSPWRLSLLFQSSLNCHPQQRVPWGGCDSCPKFPSLCLDQVGWGSRIAGRTDPRGAPESSAGGSRVRPPGPRAPAGLGA